MQVDHSKNIIEVDNVCFSYGKDYVLQDIKLNIHKGDFLGIIGPNGGGKTTLLKIMLGLLKPSEGCIKLYGEHINDFKHWEKIGYVSQKVVNFDQKFPLTVKEVVAMGRVANKGLFSGFNKQDNAKIEQALKQVEMLEYKDRLIGDLSGGQQQRVFIARALSATPEVMFLDEPTVGIDAHSQERFYELLGKLNKELGITLILISHDIDTVSHEATEIACINKTLLYEGNPKGFKNHEALQTMYGKGVTFITHTH